MRKLFAAAPAAAVTVALAGCGTTHSNSAGSTATSATATVPASTTTTASVAAGYHSRQIVGELHSLLGRLAGATGQLASSQPAASRQARAELAQVKQRLRQLSAQANSQLPAGSPVRAVIPRATQAAEQAVTTLQKQKVTPSERSVLRSLQGRLNALSAATARLQSGASPATIATLVLRLGSLKAALGNLAG